MNLCLVLLLHFWGELWIISKKYSTRSSLRSKPFRIIFSHYGDFISDSVVAELVPLWTEAYNCTSISVNCSDSCKLPTKSSSNTHVVIFVCFPYMAPTKLVSLTVRWLLCLPSDKTPHSKNVSSRCDAKKIVLNTMELIHLEVISILRVHLRFLLTVNKL